MNDYGKEILKKLGHIYASLGKPFRQYPPNYTAVAFDWYPTEMGKPYNITLIIKTVKVAETNVSEVNNGGSFIIKFDELESSQKVKGSSEAVGLIPKTSFYYDENKTAVFERNLADIMIHILYKVFDAGEECVIFAGPLFPKLAGRLGYRHFDRTKVLAAITFQTEWFPQVPVKSLLWNKMIMNELGNIFIKLPHEKDKRAYGCADIRSSNGLMETMKTWGIIPSGKDEDKKMLYALDVFCQFAYDSISQKSLWVDKLKTIKETFLFPGLVFVGGEALWLPFGLACAYDMCCKYGYRAIGETELIYRDKDHQGYIYYYERDVKRMYDSGTFTPIEVVLRRSYLYEAMYEDVIFRDLVNQALKLYMGDHGEIEKEVKLANTIARRGSSLTKIVRNIFDKPDADVTLWRRII